MKNIILSAALISFGELHAATFTSAVTGTWSAPSTWTVVGSDPDGIPDNNDDVTISSGNTVTLAGTGNCKTMNINSSGVLNLAGNVLNTWGSFTNGGSVSTSGGLQFYGNGTLS